SSGTISINRSQMRLERSTRSVGGFATACSSTRLGWRLPVAAVARSRAPARSRRADELVAGIRADPARRRGLATRASFGTGSRCRVGRWTYELDGLEAVVADGAVTEAETGPGYRCADRKALPSSYRRDAYDLAERFPAAWRRAYRLGRSAPHRVVRDP